MEERRRNESKGDIDKETVDNCLKSLPEEILMSIFNLCDDLNTISNISRVCFDFQRIIYGGSIFWKRIALRMWNDKISLFPSDHLVWAIESLNEYPWLWVARCLGNHNRLSYREQKKNERMLAYVAFGEFDGDSFKGNNVQIFADQVHSRDYLVNGNGQGRVIWMHGEEFLGDFKNFHRDGMGMSETSGVKYFGLFKSGKMEGKGVMTWPDGFLYQGEWKNDQPVDRDKAVHPYIIQCEKMEICSAVTSEHGPLPQYLFTCKNCQKDFCKRCKTNCHVCCNSDFVEKWWFICKCDCEKEACKMNCEQLHSAVPPFKKARLE